MEIRIRQLYEWLQMGIKPWEYDYERYGGENRDMIGFFYNDDLENIKQLDEFERKYRKK